MIYSKTNQNLKKKYLTQFKKSSEYVEYLHKVSTEDQNGFQYIARKIIDVIPEDYLQFLSNIDLLKFIHDRFDFIKSSGIGGKFSPMISINQEPNEIWIIDAHTIEIIHQDMSFLKNSTIELLQREGFHIRYFIVDILNSTELNSEKEKGSSFYYSFIIIEKTGFLKPKVLTKELKDLIVHIDLVTSGFHKMVSYLTDKLPSFKNEKYRNFLKFILHENFIFFSVSETNKKFGMFKDIEYEKEILNYVKENNSLPFSIIKTQVISKINRGEKIVIIKFNDIIITGIFTRKADNTSSLSIPILNEKISNLAKENELNWTALDLRDFVFAFNLLPLAYRFTIPVEGYVDFSEILYEARVRVEGKVRLRNFKKQSCYLLIIWPVQEFNEEFQKNLFKYLDSYGLIICGEVQSVLSSVVYFLYELKSKDNAKLLEKNHFDEFEKKLFKSLSSWDSGFASLLENKFSYDQLLAIQPVSQAILNSIYKDHHTPFQAMQIVEIIRDIPEKEKIIYSVYEENADKSFLNFFSIKPYSLSYLVPVLSNIGLDILSEESYLFSLPESTVYYYKFKLNYNNNPVKEKNLLNKISSGLNCIIDGEASSEPLNSLLLSSSLNIYQLELIKALVSYLVQIKTRSSRVLIKKVLQSNPELSLSIVKLFEIKFLKKIITLPDLTENSRSFINIKLPEFLKQSDDYFLSSEDLTSAIEITNIFQNEIYLGLKTIIDNIVRTNYFSNFGEISFKIKADNIDFIKKPAPLFEIWVYHPHFEGVHLRGGMISRGGIRWSDRPDDFRTEIWGLWKTQVLKNTIIVPTGAKGGFVLKYISNTRENALQMYKRFIKTLISLTDNVEKSNWITNSIPAFDNYDNYLVVAADKGTASFSDYANEISLSKSYWLGDGFASGGVHGYSHKALGITAKGAWESAKWHLHRLNIDPFKNYFSTIGIGDMSGDVFGNGMIYTPKLKLVGAFNHKHIFLDPEPDPEISYKERCRLFSKGQDWEYYNSKIISKGGGIFERESARIKLSPAVKIILDTNIDIVTGEQLIQLLLKSPVDLLFNGGIGTYIKSSAESNSDVDDLGNDSVRVNADQVRAKVIVEGGNLGVSPAGRVEYAMKGGFINTDAVDNSAGVDLSDHEVNFKILLQLLLDKGLITNVNERNKILKKHADDMVKLVLKNNFRQNWALVYMQFLPEPEIKFIKTAIEILKSDGIWLENAENLKNKNIISKCLQNNEPIPMPILAQIHSLIKIYLEKHFTIIFEDKFNSILGKYFPESMWKYEDILPKHPLKNDIIKMMLINIVVDLIGFTGIVKAIHNIHLPVTTIILYNINIYEVIDLLSLKINKYLPDLENRKIPVDFPLDLTLKIKFYKENAIYNFIEMVILFEKDILINPEKVNLPVLNKKYLDSENYKDLNTCLSENELFEIFQLNNIELKFMLKYLAENTEERRNLVEDLYFNLNIKELKDVLYSVSPGNEWEIQSLSALKKLFWNRLATANLEILKTSLEILNIPNEIKKLKDQNQLNLSTLNGIISYLFT